MTITKILIANRGEIACRIIRTAETAGLSGNSQSTVLHCSPKEMYDG
ncbi:biotin carboxylase N-terminal domain-containing protein [Hoeflea sp.]